jgi:hypothetical protein
MKFTPSTLVSLLLAPCSFLLAPCAVCRVPCAFVPWLELVPLVALGFCSPDVDLDSWLLLLCFVSGLLLPLEWCGLVWSGLVWSGLVWCVTLVLCVPPPAEY